MTLSERGVEAAARAMLATRGIELKSDALPGDAIWLCFPKDRAFAEASAAITAYLKEVGEQK